MKNLLTTIDINLKIIKLNLKAIIEIPRSVLPFNMTRGEISNNEPGNLVKMLKASKACG